jgi:PAS domain-containing protein
MSHAAAVRGHSLRLASLEAQGILTEEVSDVLNSPSSGAANSSNMQPEAWLRVADAIPDMLMLVDGEGRIVDCNVATARARNTVREALRGTRLADLVIDYDRAKAVRLYRPSLRRRDAWEVRMRSPGGKKLTVVAFDSRILVAGEARVLGLVGRVVPEETVATAAA